MKNIFYLFLLAHSFSFSQNYTALDTTDYIKRTAFIKKVNEKHTLLKETFKKKYSKKIRKEITTSYEDLFKNFSKDIENKKLVFNSEFSDYIDSLTFSIIKSNKVLLHENLEVYITKYNAPNALSMGNGYILLNMGLFKYLDNEAQLTAVLSHEIAHQVLKHSEKSIHYNAVSETSFEKQKQANRIKKKKYNKQSEAFSTFKNILYSNKKKRRKQEIEADSVGFLLFKNTNHPPKEFLNALSLLAKLDTLPNIELQKTTYQKFFDLPKQPFKEAWLKIENFNSYNYEHYKNKINNDSLKSHPELIERIHHLKTIFWNEIVIEKKENPYYRFKKLQKIARYEDVANLNYTKDYGLSIYLTLYKLENKPDDLYFKKWLGVNFNKLYEAKKKYQLNKYVDRLVPNKQDQSYQQFLSFIWNLRLNEIKIIADYYN